MRFSEVAFFHAASKTLLVTDAVVYVPEDPPEIIPRKSLLEIARDGWLSRWGGGGWGQAGMAGRVSLCGCCAVGQRAAVALAD